jgi:class 3 adenylate cyclase
MTAAVKCRSCGSEPRPDARFCDACGSPIAESQHAEYKQVTVLFADVVHSMDIAAAVGAERLREIMTDLVHAATGVVKRYGGTIDKFTGDGIMRCSGRRSRWRIMLSARAWPRWISKGRPNSWPLRSSAVTVSRCNCVLA